MFLIKSFFLIIQILPFCKEDTEKFNQKNYCHLTKEEQSSSRYTGWERAWSALRNQNNLQFITYRNLPKKRKWFQKTPCLVAWNHTTKRLLNLPKKNLILFMVEPPTVLPKQYLSEVQKHYTKIFTWNDDLVDNKRFFKYYYPVLQKPITEPVPFHKKKLSCMVLANKKSTHPKELYTKRRQIIDTYENNLNFDLYGRGWERENLACYRGPFTCKYKLMKNYRFSFCLENMHSTRGYITEKIFDAFACLTVPIYEGASNIAEEIPPNCYIDLREYPSLPALMTYLENMSETEYQTYIDNIRNYLSSKEAQRFSPAHLTELLKKHLPHNT